MTIQQAFELALEQHQSGRLAEAETIYRQILAVQPQHADALHLLGVLVWQAGNGEAGVDLIRQAITVQPHFPAAYDNLGTVLRDLGKGDEAIAAHQQATALNPQRPEPYYNLGNALREKGSLDEALAAYRRAIAARPDYAEAYCNLGTALAGKGQLDEAIVAYRKAITLNPGYAGACRNLGDALSEAGEVDEAIAAYRQALVLKPSDPEAHCSMGNVLSQLGQLDDAASAYQQAIQLKPDFADAHYNLGNTLMRLGRDNEGMAAYRRAIALRTNYAEALCNLGAALGKNGRLDEAIVVCREAVALKPDFPEAHLNLGNSLHEMGRIEEAISSYQQAIALEPNYPEAHSSLGVSLWNRGQLDDAITAFRQAIALKPDFPEAHSNLGNALNDQSRLDEAIAAYRQAMSVAPNHSVACSNLLMTLNYHPGFDASAIAEEHRRWDQQYAEPLRSCIQPHGNDASPERRLRVGYVSPDFRDHPVGRFLFPLLAGHDHQRFEIFCYAQVLAPDAWTGKLRGHADHWHSLKGLSDPQAADFIRHHQIDILVDLSGHTAHNRLLVFACKPAPVQLTWLGYPNTTGLATMDYRITDAYADPPELNEPFHSEQLIRLSGSAWCYKPNASVEVTPRADGPITFGCFNNFVKVTEPMLALWARILHAVPGSRLLLKAKSLENESTRERVRKSLGRAGIRPERLELRGQERGHEAHLALYHRFDIALDTYPYHGTTTTCEALWMGVPVVTLAGQTHASRVGASLLSSVGLAECVAASDEEYLQIAVSLANDLPRLAALRSTLRPRMEASPLMDAPRFVREMESVFRDTWRSWCAHQSSPSRT
ncbi:MAG: tetratricopeptide repeat protein [Chthoniobacteraceae bacterium]